MWSGEIRIKCTTVWKVIVSPPGALCVGAMVTLLFRGWPTESAAAWVQAVGSIGAIGAAWWLSDRQRKHDAYVRWKNSVIELNNAELVRLKAEVAAWAKAFYLIQEFLVSLNRFDDARKHEVVINIGRGDKSAQDALSRLSSLDGDINEDRIEVVFLFRQQIFDLLHVLESPRNDNWFIYYDHMLPQIKAAAEQLSCRANAAYALAQDALNVREREARGSRLDHAATGESKARS